MPSDLERLLADSLRDRADAGSPVDPVPVLRSAVAQGQRIRLRRLVAGGTIAAALVAGASVFGITSTHRAGPAVGPRPSASTAVELLPPPPEPADLARLPVAAVDGATTRPALVGSDPRVVHFSVDALAADATMVTWRVTPSYEQAIVSRNESRVFVAVTRDPAVVPPENLLRLPEFSPGPPVGARVGGRPATLTVGRPAALPGRPAQGDPVWSLVWQPVAGLWATVQAQGPALDRALQVAAQVRFDQARRCVVPFRAATPAGGTVTECAVTFSSADPGNLFSEGAVTFRVGRGYLQIRAMGNADQSGVYPRPLRAGRYQVEEDRPGVMWNLAPRDLYFSVTAWGPPPRKPYPRAAVLSTLATLHLADRTNDLTTWY
jgi:hypothetical protein